MKALLSHRRRSAATYPRAAEGMGIDIDPWRDRFAARFHWLAKAGATLAGNEMLKTFIAAWLCSPLLSLHDAGAIGEFFHAHGEPVFLSASWNSAAPMSRGSALWGQAAPTSGASVGA